MNTTDTGWYAMPGKAARDRAADVLYAARVRPFDPNQSMLPIIRMVTRAIEAAERDAYRRGYHHGQADARRGHRQ